jgi:anti-sigma28 factor (negative regulator of flagellin synthesis)
MRLHLDSSISGAGDTAQASPAGSANVRGGSRTADSSAGKDSSSVSSASSALNELSAQRAARIEQLTASVRSGQYQVSSAALSGAIVAQAIA